VGTTDRWAAWLLEHRFGGDADQRDAAMVQLGEFRDRVLAGAGVVRGDVLLDVGCGDGLIGVAALDIVGKAGKVVFSDVSADLLDECRRIVDDLGRRDRAAFVHTGLPDLAGIDAASVDVATTRSVLIYVADKATSFASLHRVLRPGGRLSMFEPINRFCHPEPADSLFGLDVTGLEDLADRVKGVYRRYQPEGNPMVDFDERDLLGLAEAAGFGEIHLDYHVDIDTEPVRMTWSTMLRHAPNPLVPTLREVLDEALIGIEREALTDRLRDQLDRGAARRRFATAYLTAVCH
jgi:SAM-dependent methyltransferase